MDTNGDKPALYLTKREAFAMAAMQGLLGSGSKEYVVEGISEQAVEMADELLRALGQSS